MVAIPISPHVWKATINSVMMPDSVVGKVIWSGKTILLASVAIYISLNYWQDEGVLGIVEWCGVGHLSDTNRDQMVFKRIFVARVPESIDTGSSPARMQQWMTCG